jgi:thioredoxin 1
MGQVQQITSADFQTTVMQSSVPVLVDFYTDHCAPCRMLAPYLEQMAEEFSGCVKFVRVNAAAEQRLSVQYRISGVPTLILFENGQIVEQMQGANPNVLRQKLAQRCAA